MNSVRRVTVLAIIGATLAPASLVAHSGPPFPIVSDRVQGPYAISVWSDPDATDDRTAAGQFWVIVGRADKSGTPLPSDTRATVSIRALDRQAPDLTAATAPVRGDIANQFASLVMDHEGRFAVRVTVDGGLGTAEVNTQVDATYDLRPQPYMMIWYLAPFLMAGLLWTRLLMRRKRHRV